MLNGLGLGSYKLYAKTSGGSRKLIAHGATLNGLRTSAAAIKYKLTKATVFSLVYSGDPSTFAGTTKTTVRVK